MRRTLRGSSGGGGAPSGAAGGVLGGTYPDPGFAADMATQAELDAVMAALMAPYRVILRSAGRLSTSGLAATKYMLNENLSDSTTVTVGGTNGIFPHYLWIDDADLAVAGKTAKLRVRVFCLVTATLTNNVTVGLYPATQVTSALSPGTVVTGSELTLTTPTIALPNQGASADFDVPADGLYLLGYTLSAVPNSNAVVHGELSLHYV